MKRIRTPDTHPRSSTQGLSGPFADSFGGCVWGGLNETNPEP
jgi:hypothetical protein